MFAKLGNGLAGTWESLDPQERILVIYGLAVLIFTVATIAGQPARDARKRAEREQLADEIARRLSRGR